MTDGAVHNLFLLLLTCRRLSKRKGTMRLNDDGWTHAFHSKPSVFYNSGPELLSQQNNRPGNEMSERRGTEPDMALQGTTSFINNAAPVSSFIGTNNSALNDEDAMEQAARMKERTMQEFDDDNGDGSRSQNSGIQI